MQNSISKFKAALTNQSQGSVPKGELWLGTELLNRAGFIDTLENHLRIVEQLGQDMICLPVTDDTSDKPAMGYRYFKYPKLREAIRTSDRFVAAVVDGPFQELANQMGLNGSPYGLGSGIDKRWSRRTKLRR